jgi:hypothetical protein
MIFILGGAICYRSLLMNSNRSGSQHNMNGTEVRMSWWLYKTGLFAVLLRFTTQVIGEDADCDPVMLNGMPLIEAKVLAFAIVA